MDDYQIKKDNNKNDFHVILHLPPLYLFLWDDNFRPHNKYKEYKQTNSWVT